MPSYPVATNRELLPPLRMVDAGACRANLATMKAIPLLLLVPAILLADDFKLRDGTEYKGVKIVRSDAAGIVIETDAGLLNVKFAELPADVQKKYGYDAEKIAAEKAKMEADLAKAREIAAQKLAAKKDQVRISAVIIQVLPGGLLVRCHEPEYVASGLGRVGGAAAAEIKATPGRAEEVYGTFYVVGHPRLKSKVDREYIDVDATDAGKFTYEGGDGSSHTIKKYKVAEAFE